MTLGIRKLIVLGVVAGIFLLANALVLAYWLADVGVVGWAARIRHEYITGTTLALIVVLLILLVPSRRVVLGSSAWIRRCPICDHVLLRKGRYCPECGGRV